MNRLNRSIKTKMIAFVCALLIAAVLSSLFTTLWVLNRSLRLQADTELHSTSSAVRAQLATQEQMLRTRTRLIGVLPILRAVVDAKDVATLKDTISSYQEQIRVPIIDVFGKKGQFLSSVGAAYSAEELAQIDSLLKQTLKDGSTDSVLMTRGGKAAFVVVGPVGNPPDISGALVLGIFLDDGFAKMLKRYTKADVSFLVNGVVSGTSLEPGDSTGREWLQEGNSVGQAVEKKDFIGQVSPLTEDNSGVPVRLAVQASLVAAKKTQRQVVLFVLLLTFVILGFAVVSGIFVSSSLSGPIIQLRNLARDIIATKDLSRRVKIDRHDEIAELGKSLNELLAQIEDYAQNLERKVQERTAELHAANLQIRAMVNSLGQGFLVFDKEGKCLPTYSKACEILLEAVPSGKAIDEVLRVPRADVGGFTDWRKTIFSEMLPFADLAPLGPRLFPHSGGRRVTLDYQPMLGDENKIEGVVVVASDETKEHEAMLEAAREHAQAAMVMKLAKNRGSFLSFIKETRGILAALKQEAKAARTRSVDVEALYRMFHTIKGGAAIFSMNAVKDLVHGYETELTESKAGDLARLDRNIEQLENELKNFFQEYQKIIGAHWDSMERKVEVEVSKLSSFAEKIGQLPSGERLKNEFVTTFVTEPIRDFFEHFNEIVAADAKEQDKQVEPIAFEGGELRVFEARYSQLFAAMVHAFRNAVDHGFEPPDERKAQGKKTAGTILVKFSRRREGDKTWLAIEVKDDGRGIDPEAIRKKLRSQGKAEIADREDDHAVIQHVFDSGLSTRSAVTSVSGRGVGMDAILNAAKELGGGAEVHSVLKKGSTLIVKIPE